MPEHGDGRQAPRQNINIKYKFSCYHIDMLKNIENGVKNFAEGKGILFARGSLFIIFFWFGILKVFGLSPANPLVTALFDETFIHSMFSIGHFLVLFGWFEMIIGILFLIPKMERVAFVILIAHMAMTFLPLLLLPNMTWTKPFVPTLEGQYIIKNLALIALAMSIAAHIREDKNS